MKTSTQDTGLYGGLDLHGDNVFCALLDTERSVVFEKRLPNDLDTIRLALEPYKGRIRELAVESTYNWYWLVDGLRHLGYTVRLANPAKMKENIGLKHANDKTDARYIARQLVSGILPEGYIYPEETRGVRDLLRHRMHMVRHRTAELSRLAALAARQTGREVSGAKITPEELPRLFGGHAPSVAIAEASLRHIEYLGGEIKALEKSVASQIPDEAAYARLETVPGIGKILASCILLETGPITRFKSAGHYASYCRAVPTEHTSNGKKKGEGNGKCGNKYLAWAFVEAAHFAVRYSPGINAWFQRKQARSRGLRVVAVKALANKLAKACFFILHDNTGFDAARLVGKHGTH
jgi:transposase